MRAVASFPPLFSSLSLSSPFLALTLEDTRYDKESCLSYESSSGWKHISFISFLSLFFNRPRHLLSHEWGNKKLGEYNNLLMICANIWQSDFSWFVWEKKRWFLKGSSPLLATKEDTRQDTTRTTFFTQTIIVFHSYAHKREAHKRRERKEKVMRNKSRSMPSLLPEQLLLYLYTKKKKESLLASIVSWKKSREE